jgi:hypothetical protein
MGFDMTRTEIAFVAVVLLVFVGAMAAALRL